MIEHSPGPWNATWSPMAIYDDDGHCVALRPRRAASLKRWPANARLMAVAPDLLVLARRVAGDWCSVRRVDDKTCPEPTCNPCRATDIVRRYEANP